MPLIAMILIFTGIITFVVPARITIPDDYPSIQAAIDNARDSDTVFIKNGTYNESISLRNNIVLIGESMKKTIVNGSRKGPVVQGAHNTLIKNCIIQNGTTGILSENTAMTIDQVWVRNNRETGIHCLVALPDIRNSIISRNGWSGILCQSTRSIKTAIMHNVIAENGYNGISLEGASEVLIVNNVIFANQQYGIWGKEEARKTRIIYNNFHNNRSSVNLYLTRDMSNTNDHPGYPYAYNGYDYFATPGITLKGKGKDGATIGLISSELLTKRLTDPDEDGILQSDDKCPSIPEDIDNYEDTDGCPEFDNDKDGIFDTEDACPDTPEDYDGYRDEDGCLDDDNDNDGIPDSVDVCKQYPEVINNYKDDDGCPDEVPPGKNTSLPSTPPAPSESEPRDTTQNTGSD